MGTADVFKKHLGVMEFVTAKKHVMMKRSVKSGIVTKILLNVMCRGFALGHT